MKKLAFGLSAVAVFAGLVGSVVEKEALASSGEVVLMALAPVDPRSLIQGDYMRLRWALEGSADLAATGRVSIVVGLDAARVASFRRKADRAPLAADERLFDVTVRDASSSFAIEPHSFLFQEGRAEAYARAKFGIFRVDAAGHHLLVGLADGAGVPIEPR